jgi:hypothetical protein
MEKIWMEGGKPATESKVRDFTFLEKEHFPLPVKTLMSVSEKNKNEIFPKVEKFLGLRVFEDASALELRRESRWEKNGNPKQVILKKRFLSPEEFLYYYSPRFYFQDPEGKAFTQKACVSLRFPASFSLGLVEHGLKRNRENLNYIKFSQKREKDMEISWQMCLQPALKFSLHSLPPKEKLPWLRLGLALNESMQTARWLERTEIWTEVDDDSRRVWKEIQLKAFEKNIDLSQAENKMNYLLAWHRQHIQAASFPLKGGRTLANGRGDVVISLATLLKTAGFPAAIFYCLPQRRFLNRNDKLQHFQGDYRARGVVFWLGRTMFTEVPTSNSSTRGHIPESWKGQKIHFWKDHHWQQQNLKKTEIGVYDYSCVTRDLTHGENAKNFFPLFPAIQARKTWMPQGPKSEKIWINADHVTVDRIHLIVAAGSTLKKVPDNIFLSVPGFSLHWKVKRQGRDVYIERIWRQAAGILKVSHQEEIFDFFETVDRLDLQKWEISED